MAQPRLRPGQRPPDGTLNRRFEGGGCHEPGSRDERGFETTFFLVFDLLGIQIETEFKTATGRVDAVVRTDASVFVMEFKYNKTAQAALGQIDDKGYLLPFERDGCKLCKVGVNFSDERQTIDDWLVEWE